MALADDEVTSPLQAGATDVVRVKGVGLDVVTMGSRTEGARAVRLSDPAAAYSRATPVPNDPAQLLLRPVAGAPTPAASPTLMPNRTTVCQCNGVTMGDIVECWHDGATTVAEVARATRATTGCGGCKDVVCGLLDWLAKADPEGARFGMEAQAPRVRSAPSRP